MCVCGCACDCTCNGWVSREDRALRTLQCGCVVGCGCVGYTKDGVGGGVESCSSFSFSKKQNKRTKIYRRFKAFFFAAFFLPAAFSFIFLATGFEPSVGLLDALSVPASAVAAASSDAFGRACTSVIIFACFANSSYLRHYEESSECATARQNKVGVKWQR